MSNIRKAKASDLADFSEIVIGQVGRGVSQDKWDSIFGNKTKKKKSVKKEK